MAIPDHETIMLPLLRHLRSTGPEAAKSVIAAISDEFDLTAEERRQLLPSSTTVTVIANRVHWAMTYLAQAGVTERPRRGVWALTDAGRELLASQPSTVTTETLRRYEAFREFERGGRDQASADEDDSEDGNAADIASAAPSVEHLLYPLLAALSDGRDHHLDDLLQDVANALDLSPQIRELRIASGRGVVENRLGWSRTYLAKAALIDQRGPGSLGITEAGQAFLARHGQDITTDTLRDECPSFQSWLTDMGNVQIRHRRADSERAVWMVRAGDGGVYAPQFIEKAAVFLGWGAVGDVSGASPEDLVERVARVRPSYNRRQRGQAANALFKFASEMRQGDVVLTPEPASRTVLLGEVSGDYEFGEAMASDYNHRRLVTWRRRIRRAELSYGAASSLGTQITLSQPAHAPEFLNLFEAADAEAVIEPLPQRQPRAAAKELVPEHVVVPANATPPTRPSTGEFQTVPRGLISLLDSLHTGALALPDFQRSFVWEADKTRELIVSMIRAFPAGALLVLQGGDESFKARAAEGAPPLIDRPSYLVLDGQQRLTSLYQALYGVGDSRFFLDIGSLLSGAEIDQAVRVFAAERAKPLLTLEAQARMLMMPLSAIRDKGGASRWLNEIVRLRDDDDKERLRDLLVDVDTACVDPLVDYKFPVTILPDTTLLEAVCTIFETLNRTGKPLTPFELISARAFKGGHSLHELWTDALDQHSVLADFEVKPYYLLQSIALRLGLSAKRQAVLKMDADDLAREWPSVVAGMAAALTMLREECGVLTPKWLPYEPMIIPLAAVWPEVELAQGPAEGAMRQKLKRWFWCASFTGEYESASATLAERDAPVLRAWLQGGPEPPVVADFNWDPARWRSVTPRQLGLYRATMALTLLGAPRDFHTGKPLTQAIVEAGRVDDHHVFPRGYLADRDQVDHVDSVLNRCLIDRTTNIRISKAAPSKYLAAIRDQLGPAATDQLLQSHQLPTGPHSPLGRDAYEEFLDWREARLDDALRAVTESGIGAAPVHTERSALDLKVEAVELALRRLVARSLGDIDQLPPAIAEKLTDRVRQARKRDPSLANGHSDTLAGHLEYADLRDLQEVLTSKALWGRFEPRFGGKEILNMRFGQLADLRNRLRHSRNLDQLARKDGEAALLWFDQVLN